MFTRLWTKQSKFYQFFAKANRCLYFPFVWDNEHWVPIFLPLYIISFLFLKQRQSDFPYIWPNPSHLVYPFSENGQPIFYKTSNISHDRNKKTFIQDLLKGTVSPGSEILKVVWIDRARFSDVPLKD